MDLSVFYEVVVPLWEMGEAVMIMISTPVDSFNFYSALLDMRDPDTGERVFLVFEVELICRRCLTRENPENCKHNLKFLPPWKSSEKLEIVKKIMRDQITILKRESMGVVTDEGGSLIESEYIKKFLAMPEHVLDVYTAVKHVLVTCDPNTSGSVGSSEMALMGIINQNGKRVIVGMDSHSTGTSRDASDFVTGFVDAIRAHPQMQNAWIIFCCERNMAHEAGFLTEPVLKHRNTVAIAQHDVNDYGWWTDLQTKVQAAYKARHCMAMESVGYMKDFICTNPWLDPKTRRQITKAKFEEQLKRYKPVVTNPKDPHSTPKVTVSGKTNKEGKVSGTFNDDLMSTFCLNVYLMEMLLLRKIPNFNYQVVFE